MHRHTTTSASHWTGLDGVARSPRSLDQLQEFETELLYEVCSLVIPPSSEKAEAAKRGTPTLARTGTLSLTTPNLTLAKRRTPTLALALALALNLALALTPTLTKTLTLTLILGGGAAGRRCH